MNRVVICGRLAARPSVSYTPHGLAEVGFQVLVRKVQQFDSPDDPFERIDCVAVGELAEDLATWGERDYRLNLEGRLRTDTYWNTDGRKVTGPRVAVDHAYFVDPVTEVVLLNPPLFPTGAVPSAIQRETA